MKKKKNPPLKINASFDDVMKALSGGRPHKDDTFDSREEAEMQLDEYRPWIKQTWIDTRDKNQPKIKLQVKNVLAAPSYDHAFGQFMELGIAPANNTPWQIVVTFEKNNHKPWEYLIDFKEFYLLLE